MKIIVDGVGGLLGSDVAAVLSKNHEVIAIHGRKQVDLTKFEEVKQLVELVDPDVFVHIAGMKDVDDSQRDPIGAYAINTLAPRNIAVVTGNRNKVMIHISSGAVFDGELGRPYTEFDQTNPVNIYGHSKLEAEELVRSYNHQSFIIRVPLLFGAHGSRLTNPIFRMIRRLEAGERGLQYTTDQLSNPSYTIDIAQAMEVLLGSEAYGTYNIGNSGEVSRYDYFKHIAQKMGYSGDELEPCLMGVKFAPREKSVVLDCRLFEETFHYRMRKWQEAMDDCIRQIKEEL